MIHWYISMPVEKRCVIPSPYDVWTIMVLIPLDPNPDSKVHGANMYPSGADRTQVDLMLAPWILLSGNVYFMWYDRESTSQEKYADGLSLLCLVWLGTGLESFQNHFLCSKQFNKLPFWAALWSGHIVIANVVYRYRLLRCTWFYFYVRVVTLGRLIVYQ